MIISIRSVEACWESFDTKLFFKVFVWFSVYMVQVVGFESAEVETSAAIHFFFLFCATAFLANSIHINALSSRLEFCGYSNLPSYFFYCHIV